MTTGRPGKILIPLLFSLSGAVLLSGCDPKELPRSCRVESVSQELTGPPAPPPAEVIVDPASLRSLLFEGNTSVLLGLNRLHQAKEQVNVARGNLLPSIQLGGLLYSGGNPAFILSTVEFLVPFLIPARWFDYYKIKDLLQAELVGLKLLRLNQYASAYSLTLAMSSDQELEGIISEEASDLTEIESIVETLYQSGAVPLSDLNTARTKAELARIHVSKISELVAGENASLRRALGLSPETLVTLKDVQAPASEWEEKALIDVLPRTLELAPESLQLSFLREAAKKDRWSKIFGFLSGASVRSEMVGSDHSAALSDSTAGMNFGIGFSYFPAIQLSKQQESALVIREQELENELTDVLDVALIAVAKAKERLKSADRAVAHSAQAYEARLDQYRAGALTLDYLLESRGSLRQAQTEALQARARLSMSRVTLHRILLSDQFESIESCELSEGV
ncbi:MAG: hypothetical protein A2X94_04085 [Bdellovibrionales bacterium GWB1_55_8]|nr:MAG: hypothetical protein A2X94_04085 [Bdellovibrionales bacterium GWB1_55_8]